MVHLGSGTGASERGAQNRHMRTHTHTYVIVGVCAEQLCVCVFCAFVCACL